MSDDGSTDACEGCGLVIDGGTAACQGLFEEILAQDFSDALRFGVHRMMVDTYSLQHPDRYCRSAKSLAAHLVGLCAILEAGASRAVGPAELRAWLDGPSPVSKPDIPPSRGALTIDHLRHRAPDEYARVVEEWAASTWSAYEPLHTLAREWLQRAMSESSPTPRH